MTKMTGWCPSRAQPAAAGVTPRNRTIRLPVYRHLPPETPIIPRPTLSAATRYPDWRSSNLRKTEKMKPTKLNDQEASESFEKWASRCQICGCACFVRRSGGNSVCVRGARNIERMNSLMGSGKR